MSRSDLDTKNLIFEFEMNRAKEICGVTENSIEICLRLRTAGVRWQRLRQGALVYDVAGDRTFEANECALEILNRLDGRHTCRAVAEELARHYSRPVDAILPDVQEFLHALNQQGFLERT
jgi:coenzyme PQQ synthesis protein D (PqqD)